MNKNRYSKNLTERDTWICKRFKEIRKTKSSLDLKQIYIIISKEMNKTYPLLWVNPGTIRQICRKYGTYK